MHNGPESIRLDTMGVLVEADFRVRAEEERSIRD
jgi:hypothetical protein